MSIVLLFGLSCPSPCPVPPTALARLEQRVVRELAAIDMMVKPAPTDALRPTRLDAPDIQQDVARALGADRVLALDYDAGRSTLWTTWFAKGVVGTWRVSKIRCALTGGASGCPRLGEHLRQDARPRRAGELDVLGALRDAARPVSRCVAAEKRRPLATRLFGRVDLDLEIRPDGKMKVIAVAPARAAKSALGRCLRDAMAAQDLGSFQGKPIKFRVPVEL